VGCAVPVHETLYFPHEADGAFRPFHMAYSDDYLFLTDAATLLRVYAFGADGRMPVAVREFSDFNRPHSLGFHKTTGTLLLACPHDGVRLLDTRASTEMGLSRGRSCLFANGLRGGISAAHCDG
jgi:hypothetical protein